MVVWAGSAWACGGIGGMWQGTARLENLCGERKVVSLVYRWGAKNA